MTAQIWIKNNKAVILATDSAVTINGWQKIYKWVNKLFALSKTEPVWIMIYWSAEVLWIPWETIIKMYRKDYLKDRSYDYLDDYVVDFIKWMEDNTKLFFSKIKQEEYMKYLIEDFIYSNFIKPVNDFFEKLSDDKWIKINEIDVKNKIIEKIFENSKIIEWAENLKDVDFIFDKSFKEAFSEYILFPFKAFNLDKKYLNIIIKSCFLFLLKKDMFDDYSWIVISWFWKKDIEPNIIELKISTVFNNKLRYKKINHLGEAVVPFAQRDEVDNFLKWIHPKSLVYFEDILKEYPKIISESIKWLNKKQIKEIDDKLEKANQRLLKTYYDNIMREEFMLPTIRMINSMPINEMCHLAESLINLTSLRKKVTSQLETVGWETEVASISKWEWFIWIKRKHYFKPELNNGFMKNYLNF